MKRSNYNNYKEEVIRLRKQGKTYGEIKNILNKEIPKSTLSCWCKEILLSKIQKMNIKASSEENIRKGRLIAYQVNKMRRDTYLKSVEQRVNYLKEVAKNKDVAKIIIGTLYLGEGAKNTKGSLMLGNSDPQIIKIFLDLLRKSYSIDESKFRCTIQCRADQNTFELEKFWKKITKIPKKQFYKTRVDPRTIGKKSKKPDYKGVCRIDYYSADLYHELKKIGELICETN
ncbi:MAG TPA: hypothetical protein PK367_02575 [Candidatus Paceibacterota bacterium]|nr:hypothetical protein [Candidatus Paceibacterota bacterium]